jgi:L-asparagine transporter-like permease
MIFVTHLFFRPRWDAKGGRRLPVRMPWYPYSTLLGAGLIVAILATTWWVAGMRVTLLSGIPWLIFISLAYLVWARANRTESRLGKAVPSVLSD